MSEQDIKISHYTNNISERQFRTLKNRISRQKVNFGMAQLVKVLTTDTQEFYENKNEERANKATITEVPTSLQEEKEIEYFENETGKGFFIVDGFHVDEFELKCSCQSQEEELKEIEEEEEELKEIEEEEEELKEIEEEEEELKEVDACNCTHIQYLLDKLVDE